MADIKEWDVEDEQFWEETGKKVATRNLWISIPSLLCGFAVWLYWSVITVQMLNLGFPFTQGELFTITAIAGFTGATFRIPQSFFIRIAGGRNTIFLTTALLMIPAAGTGIALLSQDTPLWVFQLLAFLSGLGGGNFASSMTNINAFFPQRLKGVALGINAGGGNIGATLALNIENKYQVKVIEKSYSRCRLLSERLKHSIVLNGSASEPQLLSSENIEATDVFCALTNNDESNIMMSMLAKRMGAKKVITLIANSAYAELVGDEIDIAISPQQITIGSLLTHVRKGDISNVHSLRRGAAEAIEVTAHGDNYSSKVIGRRLDEIDLPDGVTIGAIVRGDEVVIAHSHIKVQPEDHVILFLVDRSKIHAVEKLFAVGLGFFS